MENKLESPLTNLEELTLGHVCLETGETLEPHVQTMKFILSPTGGTVGGRLVLNSVTAIDTIADADVGLELTAILSSDFSVEIEVGEGTGFTPIEVSSYTLPNVTAEVVCTLRFTEKMKKISITFSNSTQLIEVLEWHEATIIQAVSFKACSSLQRVPTDLPISVRSLAGVFSALNSSVMDWSRVLTWDVSRVINFYSVFMGNDIDFGAPFRWDFRNAENLSYMFHSTTLYQDMHFDNVLATKQVTISNIFHLAQGTDDLYIGLGSLDRYKDASYAFSKMVCSGRGIESAGYEDGDEAIKLTNATYMFEQCKLKNASNIIPTMNLSRVQTALSLLADAEFLGEEAPTKIVFPNMPRVTTIANACHNLDVGIELHYDMPVVTAIDQAFNGVRSLEIMHPIQLLKVSALDSTFANIKQGVTGMEHLDMPIVFRATRMFTGSLICSSYLNLPNISDAYNIFSDTSWQVSTLDLRDMGGTSLNMQAWFSNTKDESIADLEVLFPQDKRITNVAALFSGSAWKGKGNIETIDVSSISSHSAISASFNSSQATCDLSGWCVERVAESSFTPSTEWGNTKLTGLPKWGEPCGA